MLGLRDKSVIVTGGASGIGADTVRLLGQAGVKVTVADIDTSSGEAIVKELREAGATAQFIRTDISDETDVEALVAKAVSAYGTLDGAFNNAGVPNVGCRLHEVSNEQWRRCHDVNVYGTFLCLKYEIRHMLEAGHGGAIVNCSSIAGLINVPNTAEYTASKHAVSGLTKAAACDYGKDGIRVNAIAPSAARTPMYNRYCITNPDFDRNVAAAHPLGRSCDPMEQARAAVWLMSDEASFVTGVILPVDGGYTAL